VKKKGARVTQMFQSGPEDNGQTALAMVLSCLGVPAAPWELEAVESAADLVRAARSRGLFAEGCRMTCRELCAAPLPAIVHWRSRSFVVVSRIRRGRVWVNDPEEGLRVLSLKRFEEGYTGVAVCFAGPGRAEADHGPPKAREFFPRFPAAALLMGIAQVFISVCCGAAVAALRMFAEDASGMGGGRGGAAPLFLASTLLLLAAALFQGALYRRCEEALRRQASRYCARELEKKSPLFFQRVQMHQVACACESCGAAGAAAAGAGLHTIRLWTAAACLGLIAVQDLWAAVAAALPAAAFLAAAGGQEELLCGQAKRAGRDHFALGHQTAQRLGRSDDLSGGHRRHFERWLYTAGGRPDLGAKDRLGWYWYIFAAADLAAVLCVCLLRAAAGRLGPGALTGCAGAALFFAGAMGALPRRVEAQAVLQAALETFECLFRKDGAPAARPPILNAPEDAEELTVQDVYLAPSREGDAGLRGVSLTVRRGEVLSVTSDGDGRALSRLISGIAAPAQGTVYLGGIDTRELREEELYRRVALLGREIPLPHGTVRENIAAGCGDISDLAVAQAASDALLHERILLREEGYDTPASALSDGERVLLASACAFVRGAMFLVTDACTDRLDPETERRLMDAARGRGAGVVLVTDRAEPFRWADAVCRIEEGRVVLLERAEILDWEGQRLVQTK